MKRAASWCIIPANMNSTPLKALVAPALFALLAASVAACGGSEPPPQPPPPPPAATTQPPPPADTTPPPAPTAAEPAPPPAPAKPTPAVAFKDFSTPESVLYDAKDDVYLVSNINGSPGGADNNGFISRLAPDGSKNEMKWIEAGKNGVKLDAPKGLAIAGDVLYVADLTRVRMFDRKTGKPKGEVALPGATFANDLAASADGKIVYATDTGIKFDEKGPSPTGTEAVFAIEKGKAKTIAKGEDLGKPNGIAAANGKVWVLGFMSGELYSINKEGKKEDVTKLPKGMLDGLVAVGDSMLVSSWEGQAIYRGKPGGTFEAVLSGVKSPADIGYDTKRSRVLVPIFEGNAVEAYDLK
ncbi:MAG TPA: hypothetical protein VGI39_44535 [Polyangiaceae bacterium]